MKQQDPSSPSASSKPRWLYQAQDANGQPTEGFVHATTAEEALQPPLSQVRLHSSGLYARAMTEMTDEVLGPLDVKALRQLARDQI